MKNSWVTTKYLWFPMVAFAIAMSLNVVAQTGPGGVGNSNSNKIWLDASHLSELSNGDKVSNWRDRSGNEWNAVQGNEVNRPTFLSNALNGRPVIHFDRSVAPQLLQITNPGVGAVISSSSTTFTVSKANSGGASSSGEGLYEIVFSNGIGYISGIYYTGYPNLSKHVQIEWLGGNGASPTSSYISSSVSVSTNAWSLSTLYIAETPTGTNMRAFLNGALNANKNSSSQIADYTGLDRVTLGAYATSGYKAALNGDISEVILFSANLNEAQRIIVNNYLAAKYEITITNDFYVGNDPAYTMDVQGIGTTNGNAAQKHSHVAQGKGLVITELNNSLNGTNEFLFSGHASEANSWMNDPASGQYSRWQRVWYVRRNAPIDAKLSFDFDQAGLSPVGDIAAHLSNYKLLYRASPTGSFVVVQGASGDLIPILENGDQLSFSLDYAQIPDGYYTIGYTQVNTWTGAINNQWVEPGNWNANRVPAANDHVYVNACTTCPALNQSVNIAGLRLNSGSKIDMKANTLYVSQSTFLHEATVTSSGGALRSSDFTEIKNCDFSGATILEKTGGLSNKCYGGNKFSPEISIINLSTRTWQLSSEVNNVVKSF